MKFLITMHMPSVQGNLIHQVIFEHHAESVALFLDTLNEDIFIYGKQYYKRINDDGESVFVDKGDMIINTAHIGKVQEYIDFGADDENRFHQKQRPPVRGRNYY